MIYDKLFDYQKEIIDKYSERESFGLFVSCGCGKTPLSLAFAERHNCSKIIIVSTASKALESKDVDGSFGYWSTHMSRTYNIYNNKNNFDGTGAKKYQVTLTNTTNDILLTNYESTFVKGGEHSKRSAACTLSRRVIDFIYSCVDCDVCLIVDESHKMKSRNSIRRKAIDMIKQMLENRAKSLHCYLLTGTPFTAGFEDLYTQLHFLGWNHSWTEFKDMFCITGQIPTLTTWQQPIVDYKNIKQLFELIHKYAITIKSEEVLKLPEQIFVNHKLKQSSQLLLFTCDKLKANMINIEFAHRHSSETVQPGVKDGAVPNPFYRNIAYPDLYWVADTITKFYLRAKQLSIGFQGNSEKALWYNRNRLNELEKLLEENPDNYILFYNYTPEFIEIFDICMKLDYKIDIYNGIIKSEKFYYDYGRLSEGKKLVDNKRIIIANYSSASEAKNWQLYNKCILFSLPDFKNYEQCIKRIHRPGQKLDCIYHVFYEDNWLDRRILHSLAHKKEYDENMFKHDLEHLGELL